MSSSIIIINKLKKAKNTVYSITTCVHSSTVCIKIFGMTITIIIMNCMLNDILVQDVKLTLACSYHQALLSKFSLPPFPF